MVAQVQKPVAWSVAGLKRKSRVRSAAVPAAIAPLWDGWLPCQRFLRSSVWPARRRRYGKNLSGWYYAFHLGINLDIKTDGLREWFLIWASLPHK